MGAEVELRILKEIFFLNGLYNRKNGLKMKFI